MLNSFKSFGFFYSNIILEILQETMLLWLIYKHLNVVNLIFNDIYY